MTPERQALVRKSVIAAVGATVVLTVGVATYNVIFDRPPKFARVVATDLPADTVGMVALADPAHSLELLDAAIPDHLRAEMEAELGFDPYAVASYTELGFDANAPIGAGMLGIDDPVVMVTVGLVDAERARATIHSWSAKAGIDSWTDREFDGVDGMWMAEPPVAIVFRGERMLIVGSEDIDEADEVEAAAIECANLSRRDSFAHTPAFEQVHRFPGDPLLVMIANIDQVDNHPAAAMTLGSTEIETMAFALTRDGRDIHLVWQTIFGSDSEYLGYMRNADRSTKALDQVESPVYAGVHWATDPAYLRASLDNLGRFGKDGFAEAERELQEDLGIDLQTDVIDVWTGEFGVLWTGAGEDRWGGLMFAGINDESASEATLAQIWSATEGRDRNETDAGTVFGWGWDDKNPLEAKIYDDRLWVGFGESRLGSVDGDGRGFRKTTEADPIADLVADSSSVIAFIDLVETRAMIETVPEAKRWIGRYADVIDELEAVTMRSDIDGRTLTWVATLHTNVDDAFDTLFERLVKDIVEDAGEELFPEQPQAEPIDFQF